MITKHEEAMARARAVVVQRRAESIPIILSDALDAEWQRQQVAWNRYVCAVLDRMLADLNSRT